MIQNLGPQSEGHSAEALGWAARARIVGTINDPTLLSNAPNAQILIHRLVIANQDLGQPDAAFAASLASLGGFRSPKLYLQGYVGVNPSDLPRHIVFMQRFAALCHHAGVGFVGPSWYSGGWDASHIALLRAAHWRDWCDLYGMQGYWAGPGPTVWNAFRYQGEPTPSPAWYDATLDPRTVVYTECGRDTVRDGPNNTFVGAGGWRADQISPEAYQSELLAFATRLPANVYALPFVLDPTADWANYSLNPLARSLCAATTTPLTGGTVISSAEFDRLVKNAFDRASVAYNPDSAFVKHFADQLKKGVYLGAPEEPEHPSEDGTLVLQRFANRYLWCRKSDFVVQDGPLPFA